MLGLVLLAIELGDFGIGESNVGDVAWFVVGVLLLTGLTIFAIQWNRNTSPDPFELPK